MKVCTRPECTPCNPGLNTNFCAPPTNVLSCRTQASPCAVQECKRKYTQWHPVPFPPLSKDPRSNYSLKTSSFWRIAKSWKRVSPKSLTKFYGLNWRTFFCVSQLLQFLLLWRLLVLWRSQEVEPCAVSCRESSKRKKLAASGILLNTWPNT